jgi:hypothetical protein
MSNGYDGKANVALAPPPSPLRVRHFRKAGVGVLPEGEEHTNHLLRKIMSDPNLDETKQSKYKSQE